MIINGFYAGIGARKAPKEVLEMMDEIAVRLKYENWILRSGGAEGSDSAFESGVVDPAFSQIFLPWKGFNNNDSMYFNYADEHVELAKEFHPAWWNLTHGMRKMMVRNSAQIIGVNTEPNSSFVICYTKDGKFSGGTGQALRVADSMDIPIYNLHDKDVFNRFRSLMEGEDRFLDMFDIKTDERAD